MAKITITVEDKANGIINVKSDPSFKELMRRITSGDAPSLADKAAASVMLDLRNKGQSTIIRPD